MVYLTIVGLVIFAGGVHRFRASSKACDEVDFFAEDSDTDVIPLNPIGEDSELKSRSSTKPLGLRKLAQGVLVDSGAGVTVADGDQVFSDYPLEESLGSFEGAKICRTRQRHNCK